MTKKCKGVFFRGSVLLLLATVGAAALRGQAVASAQISGAVKDPSDAPIPGAKM